MRRRTSFLLIRGLASSPKFLSIGRLARSPKLSLASVLLSRCRCARFGSLGATLLGLTSVLLTVALAHAEGVDVSVDYEEIGALRVLERQLLPDQRAQMELLELGFGVSAPDRLALGGETPLLVLQRDLGASAHSSSTSSLHVGRKLELERALDELSEELADASGLSLPFGLDCLKQPSVQEYLAIYAKPGSGTIKTWLQRSGMWREVIVPILREEGVPEDLLYLAMIESGYKPRVKSPANAGGMWQFIPGTAVDQGLRIDEWVDERFDPLKSTRAAARYLRKQYDLFGSWPLAMAAYNGGAGTVSKAISTYNATDYFKLVEYGAMYDETRRYVPRILAAAAIGKNMEAFGFEGLQLHESWSFELVQVPGGVRLSLLADAAGTELDTLRELNPELLADQTPPGDDYSLRIPNGSSSRFVSAFDELAERYGTEHERLTLRFGESVEMVAARVGIPERVLREVNGLSSRERAAYGSALIVPLANRKPADTSSADEKPLVVLPSEDFVFSNRSRYFYRVNRGDSVEELSEFFGLRSQQLALWNDLDPAAKLRDGMVLQVFLEDDFDRSQAILMDETEVEAVLMGSDEHQAAEAKRGKSSASKKGKSYTVKKGDTVSKIAKKFGVKSQDLIRWNNLDKKGTIRKGMRLVIYSK